ncbi:NPC1-like intracellular cholesterol transporter 1 [Monodelphis domestica]|uniref:NPC1-like intracellular cholesterol transporter 1 n=1 Tax=Monodelphis domestica TaxID=13616 RepID=UPI0024E227B0|nr:NPC1-like intracellular cholesterol transporter 1 [Monodelphis domestica]
MLSLLGPSLSTEMVEPGLRGVLLLVVLLHLVHGESYTPIHEAGRCAFYNDCGKNPELSGSLIPLANVSCLSNTPAFKLSGDHLELLNKICPELYQGPDSTYACCSIQQLLDLQGSLSISKTLLTRCPACAENFAAFYCHNTCSPNQSVFINVTRIANISGTNSSKVLAYETFYTRDFAERAYNSCNKVQIPATGGLAVGAMCGVYGAKLCNAQRWLNFQGDTGNGLAPLEVTFNLVDPGQVLGNGLEPLDVETWGCNETRGNGSNACSCQDCASSCPVIAQPAMQDSTFRLGRMHGGLALAILLSALFVSFFTFLVVRSCQKTKAKKPKQGVRCSDRFSYFAHVILGNLFQSWGTWVASRPKIVLCLSTILVVALASGLVFLELTTNPVELWSAPNSQARKEKEFHDRYFGPFFRTNQVILTAPNRPSYTYNSLLLGPKNFSGILSEDLLLQLLELQEELRHMEVWSEEERRNISLRDVCYAPLNPRNPSLEDCCINSFLQYFQSNRTNFLLTANQTLMGHTAQVDWRDHYLYCVNSPLTFKDGTTLALSCMADYGAPVFPFLAVGGYTGQDFSAAEALLLTFSLNNYPAGDPRLAQTLLWESRFLEVMRDFQKRTAGTFDVTFMAERSLEDEINRTTAEDLPVFAISYAIVFLYISLALGRYSSRSRLLVDSKITLGLGGVLIVLGSVLSSMGFFSYLGVPSSMVIIQVVPFLVLAVGADNIFIFVLEYQRLPRHSEESREVHIGRVLGTVAPSMLLCSLSEAICFFLGALTSMPAVRTFALTAGLAIIFDFLLQMSAFVALLSLDSKRQEASRLDICCCVNPRKLPPPQEDESLLLCFFRKFYAPFLLHGFTRIIVLGLFMALFGGSLYLMCHINVGLDQELALPEDSYLLDYFHFLNRYFEVGVPTYFVTTSGFNFSSLDGMNSICSSSGCDTYSLTQKIQYATEFPKESYLAIPASSWVDDFIDWLTPTSDCCRLYRNNTFCSSTEGTVLTCFRKCIPYTTSTVRPTVEQFHKYLPWFLEDKANIKCPKGGLGAYDGAVNISADGEILATRFMAYHTPLKNSQEYTAALRAARELAANITADLRRVPGTDPKFEVFPYTVTYVFYEQYLTIVPEGLFILGLCLIPTFAVSCLLLGMDLRSGLLNLFSIIMILVDTVGFMTLWGISYNAVSLINLVTAVGISVEFVSHITRSFAISTKPSRLERAKETTIIMGSAVFAGVAMTNLPGIIILAAAKAQLIQIFFFRLNLLITIFGMLHGLVFLPVILSYFGPDIKQVLVLEQQPIEKNTMSGKAEVAKAASCSTYPSPLYPDLNSYTNLNFEADVTQFPRDTKGLEPTTPL